MSPCSSVTQQQGCWHLPALNRDYLVLVCPSSLGLDGKQGLKKKCLAAEDGPENAEAGHAPAADMPPAPGLGQAVRPTLERASMGAGGPPSRPVALRRSSSFGMQRPGSGAGSFGAGSLQRSHSYIARHRSFRDLSAHSTRSVDSGTEEPLLRPEQ